RGWGSRLARARGREPDRPPVRSLVRESSAMRSHHPRSSWRLWAFALLMLALLAIPHAALAQVSIDPTATPTKSDGGWVYWMAEASIALAVLVVVLSAAAYLR